MKQKKLIFSYKLRISYQGTNYSGWQFQTHNENTVQSAINLTLQKILKTNSIKTIAVSRTDTGVHAQGQAVKLETNVDVSPNQLLDRLNYNLPDDIKVINIDRVNNSYNIHNNIVSKEYNYILCKRDQSNAYVNNLSHIIDYEINLNHFQEICSIFEGKHDFSAFCVDGGRNSNKIRTIEKCCIYKKDISPIAREVYFIQIISNGFLKYMVRRIVASILNVYTKKLNISEIQKSLKTGSELSISNKSPSKGLHLIEIKYND